MLAFPRGGGGGREDAHNKIPQKRVLAVYQIWVEKFITKCTCEIYAHKYMTTAFKTRDVTSKENTKRED